MSQADRAELEAMTKAELEDLAEDMALELPSRVTKGTLVDAILDAEQDEDDDVDVDEDDPAEDHSPVEEPALFQASRTVDYQRADGRRVEQLVTVFLREGDDVEQAILEHLRHNFPVHPSPSHPPFVVPMD